MELTLRHRDKHLTISLHPEGGGKFRVTTENGTREATAAMLDPTTLHLVIDGHSHLIRVTRAGQDRQVGIGEESYVFSPEAPGTTGAPTGNLASPKILAPMPGKVLQVFVKEGQEVAEGDGLLVLEAMKMENRIVAEAAGVVKKVNVEAGQMIDGGIVLLELEYA